MRSFKSNENIHKKEGGSYYVVSANKASSVTLFTGSGKSEAGFQESANASISQFIQVNPYAVQDGCHLIIVHLIKTI